MFEYMHIIYMEVESLITLPNYYKKTYINYVHPISSILYKVLSGDKYTKSRFYLMHNVPLYTALTLHSFQPPITRISVVERQAAVVPDSGRGKSPK